MEDDLGLQRAIEAGLQEHTRRFVDQQRGLEDVPNALPMVLWVDDELRRVTTFGVGPWVPLTFGVG